tara:strand:- start:1063 stop:1290 length:228 start_codon:yes stop_codon:yes gene_type:complete
MYTLREGKLKSEEDQINFKGDNLVTLCFEPPLEMIEQANSWRLLGTSFDDEGEDYTELQLIKGDDIIWNKIAYGY